LKNAGEALEEFEGRMNAEIKRQENIDMVEERDFRREDVKIVDGGLYSYFFFSSYFIFIFLFFSIFRTTRVRAYQSQVDGIITRLIMGLKRME